MNYQNLKIHHEYKTLHEGLDVVKDFLIPTLSLTKTYFRSSGYFSSTSLSEILRGIQGLIENDGKMKIITSPDLSEKDIQALQHAYEDKTETITENILNVIKNDHENIESYSLLYHLVKSGYLDIKIAYISNENGIGIFHEKTGVLEDNDGNIIAFNGSMNETRSGFVQNYESIDVFCSWDGGKDEVRVLDKKKSFEKLWNNEIPTMKIVDFPEAAFSEIDKIALPEPKWLKEIKEKKAMEQNIKGPKLPFDLSIRDYQKEAIANWEENNYKGIFSMATGTGKTFTGLAAAEHLFKKNNNRLAIVIVVPYQHLVMQWVEDVKAFGMKPIIGFSASPQKNWKKNLANSIFLFNRREKDWEHFCFITTNASFSLPHIQNELKKIEQDLLLIVDEAHNFGASHLQNQLLWNAEYRLGLSATIERHNDEEGTHALLDYFHKVVMEYSLKDAIDNEMLTPYYYYPIVVELTETELEEYLELTKKIGSAIQREKNGKIKLNERAKMLLIQRARIVAGAEQKITKLVEEIEKYKDDSQILVYCGATTITDPDFDEGKSNEEEIRQIDLVSKKLGHDLNMSVAQFTSNEKQSEREEILKAFSEGEQLQVLAAIRCLDEGVNIPSIEKAFILASSTNPKEYIQRRGRVLRLYEGKKAAYIYDFITLPVHYERVNHFSEEEIESMKNLAKREVTRMEDFSSLALNSFEANHLIFEIQLAFNFSLSQGEEDTI